MSAKKCLVMKILFLLNKNKNKCIQLLYIYSKFFMYLDG